MRLYPFFALALPCVLAGPVEICGHDNVDGCVPMENGELFGAICTLLVFCFALLCPPPPLTPCAHAHSLRSSICFHLFRGLVCDLHPSLREGGTQ